MNRAHLLLLLSLSIMCNPLAGCMSTPQATMSSAAGDIRTRTGQAARDNAGHLSAARGGPAVGMRDPGLEPVAIFDGPAMPVGITVSKTGRTFMSFPRWLDPVKSTLVELKDGKLIPFPDAPTNAFDATKPDQYKPADHLISVQAVVFDEQDRLWVLDPGSFNFGPNLPGGPKLWCYDIATGQRIKAITFPTDVALKLTELNDVRLDLHRGAEGTAYITDSGVGGIIVVDIASGHSWRHLDHHPSVVPAIGLQTYTEGQPFMTRKSTGEVDAPDFRSDGIALSPDGKTLYYMPVISHEVYAVPTDLLADEHGNEAAIGAAVKTVAHKPSGNDGIWCDDKGQIYATDFEENAIRKVDPVTGGSTIVVQDERLLWPDTLALAGGYLYVTSNQLARQPNYHGGKDQRQPPYALFRINVGQ